MLKPWVWFWTCPGSEGFRAERGAGGLQLVVSVYRRASIWTFFSKLYQIHFWSLLQLFSHNFPRLLSWTPCYCASASSACSHSYSGESCVQWMRCYGRSCFFQATTWEHELEVILVLHCYVQYGLRCRCWVQALKLAPQKDPFLCHGEEESQRIELQSLVLVSKLFLFWTTEYGKSPASSWQSGKTDFALRWF